MKKLDLLKLQALLLFVVLFLGACNDDEEPPIDPNDGLIEVPTIFSFDREGTTSVSYPGQTTRQLLIQDMKIAIDALGASGATALSSADDLLKFYDYSLVGNETLKDNILTTVGGTPSVTTYYEVHPDKDLKGKMDAGYPALDQDIVNWVNILVTNSQDPNKLGTYEVYIDPATGYDLAQMIQKTLLGAVAYSQGVNTYLLDIVDRPNDELRENANYTDMEHRFDEAWGYYGGARNMADFTDNDLASKDGGVRYKDNFVVDNTIDWGTEYNFAFSTNAGKRDRGSTTGTDFSKVIFDAFLAGRTAIVNKDLAELSTQRQIILDNWEKVIAATAIHYINDVTADLNAIKADPTTSPKDYYKHWGEMFKFAEMLRYNRSTKLVSLQAVLDKMVTADVPYPKTLIDDTSKIDAYLASILEARNTMQSELGFDASDVANW